ncbi:hypothetical protein [Pseudomonas yamanorum]|jgi:hypothetical protein|uniref:hypothetical protein n=1 Tax=Pseudomonas yamanorum TaxID=515393 RepID=UPI003B9E121E
MKTTFKRSVLTMLITLGCINTAWAALTPITPADGKQCRAASINNSTVVVGNCTSGDALIPSQPWVAATPTNAVILPRLAPAQPCTAAMISNAGWIAGDCGSPSGANFGVTWNANDLAAGIIKLQPRSGLIGLFPDISTRTVAMNQRGGVLGSSLNQSGVSTVVLWAAGKSTPQDVSSPGDNCRGVDINFTLFNGRPTAALNCPNANGTMTGKIARHNGLLYVATALPKPTGALTCVATAINDSVQVIGGCQYASAPFSRAVFWASPTSTPVAVPTLNNSVSIATLLNNAGKVVVAYEDADGNGSTALWDTTGNSVTLVPAFTTGVGSSGVALADNGTLLVMGANSATDTQSATWDPVNGLQSLGFYNGGLNTMIDVISQDGSSISGAAEDSTQTITAVLVQ